MAEAVLKLGQKGQVIIPAELRRKLHWKPGNLLRVIQSEGRILLEAATLEDQAIEPEAESGVDDDPIWKFIGGGTAERTHWSTNHTRKIDRYHHSLLQNLYPGGAGDRFQSTTR